MQIGPPPPCVGCGGCLGPSVYIRLPHELLCAQHMILAPDGPVLSSFTKYLNKILLLLKQRHNAAWTCSPPVVIMRLRVMGAAITYLAYGLYSALVGYIRQ